MLVQRTVECYLLLVRVIRIQSVRPDCRTSHIDKQLSQRRASWLRQRRRPDAGHALLLTRKKHTKATTTHTETAQNHVRRVNEPYF